MKEWFIYIVECADNSLYTGITTDVARRIIEHNDADTSNGAKYTRARLPVKLVYYERACSRSDASKREMEIKKLERKDKLKLVTLFKKNNRV